MGVNMTGPDFGTPGKIEAVVPALNGLMAFKDITDPDVAWVPVPLDGVITKWED